MKAVIVLSHMREKRTISLVCLGLAGSVIYATSLGPWGLFHNADNIASGGGLFTSLACRIALLAILYLSGILLVFHREAAETKSSCALYVIIFFALLYRLLLVSTHPVLSSDMYRYIWDGRVQAHGINPYLYAPGDEALGNLRDQAIYPHMNRHASPTIYPAGAQMLFLALNRLGIKSISAFKGAVVLFDMGSVLVLITMLVSLGLARERVLVYAWHPLVIFELAGSGHLEGFMVFFVLLSLLLLMRKRMLASISSLALAASLKLYPAIILPAVLREKKFRGCLLFSTIFILIYLPYLTVGKRVVGFLPQYLESPAESFNLGLKAYLLKLFPNADPLVFTAIFAAVLLAAAALTWINRKDAGSALKFAYILSSLQIILSAASFQPWYVIWIIPFLAFFPSPAWLYFSFALFLSYLAYSSPGGALPEWVRHTEYIPFFVLLAVETAILLRAAKDWFPWRPGKERRPQELYRPEQA